MGSQKSNLLNIFLTSVGFFFLLLILCLITSNLTYFFIPLIFLLFSFVLIFLFRIKEPIYYVFFYNIYTIGIFWILIASIYRIYLNDHLQNTLDANNFYVFASMSFDNVSLLDLVSYTEGSLAIYIWSFFYKFFDLIGFGTPIIIGVLLNNLNVCFTGLIGLKICKLLYPNKPHIWNTYVIIFPLCAIFWLFQSVHIRDSFILLMITIMYLFSIKYLYYNRRNDLILFIIVCLLFFFAFPFLRTEFYILPILFLILAYSINKLVTSKNILVLFLLVFFLVISVVIFLNFSESYGKLLNYFFLAKNGYADEVNSASAGNSLGQLLIFNQPIFIRIILGVIYLQIYPIPFWFGFKLDTIYDLFVSLNLIFWLCILPLVYLSLNNLKTHSKVVKVIQIYSLLLYLIMVVAITTTSLEIRHIAVFYVPLIIQASTFELNKINKKKYIQLLSKVFLFEILIHILWFILKYFR